jgi:alpha-beta hydrolase superfamily lysophospholipase
MLKSLSKHSFFELADGTQLRVKIQDNKSESWIFVLHGLGEHYERHTYISDVFKKKYNYIYFDHRGHGLSSGKKGSIERFSLFAEDFKELFDFCMNKLSIKSYALFAHSMGALIACDFIKQYGGDIIKPKAVFLSSAALSFPGIAQLLEYYPLKLTSMIKDIPFSFDLENEDDYKRYSHDPKVLEVIKKDPLINHHTESKLKFKLFHKANEITSAPINFPCPVSLVIGSLDKIVNCTGVVDYFSNIEKIEKITVVPGGFHELFVETDEYRSVFIKALSDFMILYLPLAKYAK